MKQYTTPDQTAKLIELGFEKPYRPYLDLVETYGYSVDAERNYSIGELIEMLPPIIDEYSSGVINGGGRWSVHYKRLFTRRYDTSATELTDALYNMIIKLKEEGVI